MCEIQLVCKQGKNSKLSSEDVVTFMNLLEVGSWSNRDAYGIFTDKYMFRKGIAFYDETDKTVNEIRKNVLEHKPHFVVGHNRLTTKGNGSINHNNHPFPTKDWIVVHNGVLSNDTELQQKHFLEYDEETDSAIIVNLLQKYYDETNKPLDCVKKVAEEITGSFSIVAYNKTENKLFYFKNSSTSFYFRLYTLEDNSKVLVGSTSDDNFDNAYVVENQIFYEPLYKKYLQTEAEHSVIYEITKNSIEVVDEFTPAVKKYSSSTTYSGGKNSTWKRTGGYYENDWENEEEWNTTQTFDYAGRLSEITPELSFARQKNNLEEDVSFLSEEIEDCLGCCVHYDIKYATQTVIFRLADCPKSMTEVIDTLRNEKDIRVSENAGHENEIAVSFEELQEIYA